MAISSGRVGRGIGRAVGTTVVRLSVRRLDAGCRLDVRSRGVRGRRWRAAGPGPGRCGARATRAWPRGSSCRSRRVQPPSGCCAGGEPVELGLDARRARTAPAPGRPGSGAKSSGRMNSSSAPPATCSSPSAGTCGRSAVDAASAAPGVVGGRGVEQLHGEREHHRVRLRAQVAARRRGSTSVARASHGCSATAASTGGHPVRGRRDHRGDLQRGLARVRRRPERRAGGRVGHRQGERQPAVGQRSPTPASRTARAARGGRDRRQVGEHLERVQRAAGLAGARAQVGLQAPAVAAVGGCGSRRPRRAPRPGRRRRTAGRSAAGRARGRTRRGSPRRRTGRRSSPIHPAQPLRGGVGGSTAAVVHGGRAGRGDHGRRPRRASASVEQAGRRVGHRSGWFRRLAGAASSQCAVCASDSSPYQPPPSARCRASAASTGAAARWPVAWSSACAGRTPGALRGAAAVGDARSRPAPASRSRAAPAHGPRRPPGGQPDGRRGAGCRCGQRGRVHAERVERPGPVALHDDVRLPRAAPPRSRRSARVGQVEHDVPLAGAGVEQPVALVGQPRAVDPQHVGAVRGEGARGHRTRR